MKNKDAAIYKALAECGFDVDGDFPDIFEGEDLNELIDPDKQFLDAVEHLFKSDGTDSDKS